jgi:hypothetical protein
MCGEWRESGGLEKPQVAATNALTGCSKEPIPMKKYEYVPPSYRDRVLGILEFHVDDDRFLQVFGEISKVIRASAQRYENADDGTIEAEGEYIDELLGIPFVLLQAKIRRVRQWAKDERYGPKTLVLMISAVPTTRLRILLS